MKAPSVLWPVLRRLLPPAFARRYGDELLSTHLERAEKRGYGRLRLNVLLIGDVLATAAQLRVAGNEGTTDRPTRSLGESMGFALHHAWRSLSRARAFSLSVVIALALGIGATATLFTVTDRLLLSAPPHVADAGTLRKIFVLGVSPFTRERGYTEHLSYPDFVDLAKSLDGTAIAGFNRTELTIGEPGRTHRAFASMATANYFATLGVQPARGRFLLPADDEIGAPPVAILSDAYWRREFGGDPSTLGRTVRVGKGIYTIVGIAPRGFTGVDLSRVDLWLPLRAANAIESGTGWTKSRRWYWMSAVARVSPGDEASLSARATHAYRRGRADLRNDDRSAEVVLASVIGGRGPEPSDEARIAPALAGLALMVLLLTCANVGNLVLVRGIQRRRAVAIQTAMGLSPRSLMAVAFTEVLLLASVGAAVGLAISYLATPALFKTLLPTAAVPEGISLRLAAFMAGIVALTTVITGLLPALRATRIDAFETLRFTRESRHGSRSRTTLLFVQAALCAFLLVGAGVFLRSLQRAQSLDFGVDPATRVVQLELNDGSRFGESVAKAAYVPLERIRRLPSVGSAAVTSIPQFFGNWGITILTERDSIPNGGRGPYYFGAGGQYFESVGLRILRGRALTDADDHPGTAPVAVVSASLSRRIFGQADPIGKCLYVEKRERCTSIVGVAEDVLPDVRAEAPNYNLYLPPHHPDGNGLAAGTIMARASGDVATAIREIRAAVLASNADVRMVEVRPLRALIDPQLRSWRLGSTLLIAFGALALVVAIAGIFSALSFEVAQRRFELAVRSALGAGALALVRASTIRSLIVCGTGAAVGLALAAVATARAADLLFHVSPLDPAVIGGVLGLMLAAISLSSALPSWRAVRADPKGALEGE